MHTRPIRNLRISVMEKYFHNSGQMDTTCHQIQALHLESEFRSAFYESLYVFMSVHCLHMRCLTVFGITPEHYRPLSSMIVVIRLPYSCI